MRWCVLWVLLGVWGVGGLCQAEPIEVEGGIRGMTVSCYRSGRGEWDGPGMGFALDELRDLGVNGMSFHPYGWIEDDGRVRYERVEADPMVLSPIREAHDRGMVVMHKPHLGYWRSRFSWRGEIRFETEAAWERFFASYRVFIVHQAELAERAGAEWFVVGTELDGTLEHERLWRSIIAEVRGVYSGKLTYAANWSDFEEVGFWDALDAVGIQAYFPLTDSLPPSEDELRAAWGALLARLEGFSREVGRPVLLTELGYAAHPRAAAEPWLSGDRGARTEQTERLKELCLRVALEATGGAGDWLEGVFLWKWFPSRRENGREFTLQYPGGRAVLEAVWGGDGAALGK